MNLNSRLEKHRARLEKRLERLLPPEDAPPETLHRAMRYAVLGGGKVEAGVRFGSTAFFAEPLVSLAYSRISLDDVDIDGNAFDYDGFTGLRGKAGLRLGGSTDIGGGSTVAFYVGGAAVKEFEGEDGLRFTSGGQTIALVGDQLGTYGQGTLGVNITMAGGISGFIEGHGEFGDEYRGGGGRAGLRIAF